MAYAVCVLLLAAVAAGSVWGAPDEGREESSLAHDTTPPPLQVAVIDGASERENGYQYPVHLSGPRKDYVQLSTGGFYQVHKRPRSWFDARAACEAEGAHLLVLESAAEAAAVRRLLASIDLVAERKGIYTLHAGFRADLVSVLGESVKEPRGRWSHGNPTGDFCGRIDNDAWLLYGECSEWKRFVCEYGDSHPRTRPSHFDSYNVSEFERAVPPQPPSKGYTPLTCCPGTSYKILRKTDFRSTSWSTEQRICANDGAHLPFIDSDNEAEDVIDLLQQNESTGNFFLGLATGDPITVLGGPMSNINYQRWDRRETSKTCFKSSKKLRYFAVPCDISGYQTVQTVCEINNN